MEDGALLKIVRFAAAELYKSEQAAAILCGDLDYFIKIEYYGLIYHEIEGNPEDWSVKDDDRP